MNCIELSDNPFQGVWIVWFAMLMLAAGCDSIRRRRHHCRSKWAESARTPQCTRCTRCNLCRIVTHCASLCHVVPSLCHVVPCCAIGIHWDPLGLSACRFAPPFAMLKWGLPQSVHSERPSRTSQCYWPLAVESQTYFFDFLCRELIQWTSWARSWDSCRELQIVEIESFWAMPAGSVGYPTDFIDCTLPRRCCSTSGSTPSSMIGMTRDVTALLCWLHHAEMAKDVEMMKKM